ncbi:MAG: phytanoyl-CoA dioxygenase family protein [Crocinitomicaceae bacterium]|nr:phytanoyl-CoA dioxygenase family protein [Crocinitomicaceae bacterium]
MKEAIFKDETIQNQFEKDGFVKISLLDQSEIDELASMREHYFPEMGSVFFSSSYLDDFDLKTEISDRIKATVQSKIAKYFTNYRLIGAAYLIKGIGPHSEMPMHQDWTIVDESEFYAVNVWIPLTTTNEENGTLELMKGSHRWNSALRAPTLPMSFDGHQHRILPKLTVVEAKLGEVIVLNQATIHYSKPNNTDEIRPAITAALISEKAQLKFHYWDKARNQIEEFSQKDDFLLRFENFMEAIYKRPLMGESLGYFDYVIPEMSEGELNNLLGQSIPKQKPSFLQRIFSRS